MWGMNNNSVVSQMGDIGNTILQGIGISPWGPQNPNDYQTYTQPGAKPQFQTAPTQATADAPLSNIGMPEGFFSHAENVLKEAKQGIFSGDQLLGFLKGKGVKDEEIKWTGLMDLAKKPKVTREEALKAVQGGPGIGEHVLDSATSKTLNDLRNKASEALQESTHYYNDAYGVYGDSTNWPPEVAARMKELDNQAASITIAADALNGAAHPQYETPSLNLPGPRNNYKEILLTHEPNTAQKFNFHVVGAGDFPTREDALKAANNLYYDQPKPENFISAHSIDQPAKFDQSHWDKPNVVAHLRLNERPTLEGGLASHSEEYQSDWANAAKSRGIKDPNKEVWHPNQPQKDPVENAPYIRGSWSELAAKRHLQEAARNPNVTDVTWTTGAQQAQRYSMDQHYDRLLYDANQGRLLAYPKGNSIPTEYYAKPEELANRIGAELAQKLLAQPKRALNNAGKELPLTESLALAPEARGKQLLEGPDLKVENKGKRAFYDNQMPSTMKRLTKQEPKLVDLPNGEEQWYSQFAPSQKPPTNKVWGIKMTPELRNQILTKGFPLYVIPAMMAAHELTQSQPLPPPMMVNH